MSIITVFDIQRRAENGYADPSLPIAVWQVGATVIGNASGGVMSAQINLKAAGVPPGNFFSLEEVSASAQAVTTNAAVQLEIINLGTALPSLPPRVFSIPLLVQDSNAELHSEFTQPKLFLGRAQTTVAAAVLTFTIDNNNGRVMDVTARGYMWTPRSILSDGGIRRPLSGMFPN